MSHTVVVMGSVIGDWESVLLTLGLGKEAVVLYEFLLKTEDVHQAQQVFLHEQQQALQPMRELAAATSTPAEEDAGLTFLRTQLHRLRERVHGAGLHAKCDALLIALRQRPMELSEHLQSYQLLLDEAAGEIPALDAEIAADALLKSLAEMRDEIESSFVPSDENTSLKTQLRDQLAGLEGMATRQRKIAAQGLFLLQQRVYRELRAQAEREAMRQHDAEIIRQRIGHSLPRLQSISRQLLLPESAAEATRLLARLAEGMAMETALELKILDEADALFAVVQQRLRDRFTASYLAQQVTDVLHTMGYAVSQIPAESGDRPASLVTRVDGELGLQVEFDNTGGMTTELVSLADTPLLVNDAQQEKICSLVDHIIESLQHRHCAIRERYRAYLNEDEHLRAVEIDTADGAAMYQALASRIHEEVEIDSYE